MPLYPSPAIRYKFIDGLVVLLHLTSGSYYILDEIASMIWQACVEHVCEETAFRHLSNVFEVEPGRLKADFDSFTRNCLQRGFLVTARGDPDKSRIRLARVSYPLWHAWICLVRTAISLRWRGLAVTYLNCVSLSTSCPPREHDRSLPRALRAFLLAENCAPLNRAPNDCLPRSLALFRFLRHLGFPVEHCIGVARYPFHAHAWVEYRGEVLLDVDRRAQFSTLARIDT